MWQSTLEPAIDWRSDAIGEADRVQGLEHIRRANSALILQRLGEIMSLRGRRVLDVGCAYGWFLTAAAGQGMTAVGIEPDVYTCRAARAEGLDVRRGYFPDSLTAGEEFDLVVFNDVLEHIPDVHRVLATCASVVARDGLIVISVPTNQGMLFRCARVLAQAGFLKPWERLWQKPFPSPHRYYFSRESLDLALARHRLVRRHAEGTISIRPRGLWSRLRFDRKCSIAASAVLYAGLLSLYPVYRIIGRTDKELLIYGRET
jgi:SAM-dependent methyltransferase